MPTSEKLRVHRTTQAHVLFVQDWQVHIPEVEVINHRLLALLDHGYGPCIELSNPGKPAPFREKFTPTGRVIFPDGKVYEIVCAFRLESEPNVWRYFLQELPNLGADWEPKTAWGYFLPRIIFDCFQNDYAAVKFFEDAFSRQGVVKQFTTSQMLQATFIQQGELREEVITLATMPVEMHLAPQELPSGY